MRAEHWLHTVPLRLRSLFQRRRVEQELDDEIRDHIERQTAENISRGMRPEQARTVAMRAFGGVERWKEESRDTRRVSLLENSFRDVHYALRSLRRSPGFTAVAGLTLALGIGATSTVFSVANTLLLRPMPFPNGERIAILVTHDAGDPRQGPASIPEFHDWQQRLRAFSDVAALYRDDFRLMAGDEPVRLTGAVVTSNFFRMLGVRPERGRFFSGPEARAGGPLVVVVSHGLADRYLGGVEGAVGAVLKLNGQPYDVVGVLATDMRLPDGAELWVPLTPGPRETQRGNQFLSVGAVLKPGVSLQEAQLDLSAVAAGLARDYPEYNTARTAEVVPLRERYVQRARPAFAILVCAALLLFAIAGANVVSLQLARATARAGEIAMRSALGASRSRLLRQLLTESLVLSLVGGGLGIGLAVAGSKLVGRAIGANIPPWMTFSVDVRVLAFTVSASVTAAVLFGLAPALRLARAGAAGLRPGQRTGLDLARGRLYRGVVATEIALSLVLLVGASLALQSFLRMQRIDPGFDPSGVITFRLALDGPRYPDAAVIVRSAQEIVRAVRALPGIADAGLVARLPVSGCCSSSSIRIEGQPVDPGHEPEVWFNVISPGYFEAIGLPLVAGRDFTERDGVSAAKAYIVNEAFAKKFWPGESALGRRVMRGSGPVEIVGVVRDLRQYGLLDVAEPTLYVPHAQDPWGGFSIAARVQGRDAASVTSEIRQAVRSIDPELPVFDIATMRERIGWTLASQRLFGRLFGSFALIALILACAGVYGVTAYYVARRTNEIGVRMALGADRGRVLALVLRQAIALVGVGVTVGTLGSVAAAAALAHVLYGVSAREPMIYAVGALALTITVGIAMVLPARRAAGIDPMRALRAE